MSGLCSSQILLRIKTGKLLKAVFKGKMSRKYYFQVLILLLVLVLSIGYLSDRFYFNKNTNTNKSGAFDFLTKKLEVNTENTVADNTNNVDIPESYEIKNVPFQSQAPNAVWDQLHDEACEEASITIAKYYLDGKSLSAEEMESEIQKLVSWQEKNWGGHYDLTAEQTADLAKLVYNIDLKVLPVNNISDIKAEVSQNRLVIVPTAGRLLGNPNFRSPGPVYHMLVVSGYNQSSITTQDVGTRNGKNYIYANSVLFNAIHDWAGSSEAISSGQKVMLVAE